MTSEITHQDTTTSTWSWLNPFSYFGSTQETSALGRNAPSKDFTKVLLSDEGKMFVATTPKELKSIINGLKKVSDDGGEDFGKLIREGKDIPRNLNFDDMSEQSEVLSELRKTVPPRNEDVDPNEGGAPEAPPAPVYKNKHQETKDFLAELKDKTRECPPHTTEGGYSYWNPIGYIFS